MEKKPKKILLGLTTTPGSDWREKVEEMKRFGIREVALFPTYLVKKDREELYGLLEDIEGLNIPHVHLREEDMAAEELAYLDDRYHPVAFNVHVSAHGTNGLVGYRDRIYVENQSDPFPAGIFDEYAGLCLDTQHLKYARFRSPKVYREVKGFLAENVTVGCCHISPFPALRNYFRRRRLGVESHYMIDIREYDYVKEYVGYLPEYVSIEAENSFEEQIAIKEYLEKIINGQ
ncbi:MAG: hypothetical protein HGA31_02760 [Candidatus Moranbacteria bacterium]|nr:hypothetical protein [Candidatus Moranbacteria bacterium]